MLHAGLDRTAENAWTSSRSLLCDVSSGCWLLVAPASKPVSSKYVILAALADVATKWSTHDDAVAGFRKNLHLIFIPFQTLCRACVLISFATFCTSRREIDCCEQYKSHLDLVVDLSSEHINGCDHMDAWIYWNHTILLLFVCLRHTKKNSKFQGALFLGIYESFFS